MKAAKKINPVVNDLTFEARRDQWSWIREVVFVAKSRGHKVELFEGPGIIFRSFRIAGDKLAVLTIEKMLKKRAAD